MKKDEFVMLCLKVMGIFFLLLGITSIPHLIEELTEPRSSQWSFSVSPLLNILCGAILFFKANLISHYITEANNENEVNFTPTSHTVRIALMVLGVFILSQAIPHFFQIFANSLAYHLEMSSIPKHLRQIQQHFIYIVSPTIKIVIGVWLVFGNKGLVKLLGKFDNTFKELDESNKSINQTD